MSSVLSLFGVPLEFFLFGATLLGIAVFHHRTFTVAATGVSCIVVYKLLFVGFAGGPGLPGFVGHMAHEWVTLANLALLLTGFELIARHFEKSRLPDIAPEHLPHGWLGALLFLAGIFVLSGLLDNIALAVLGAAMARHIFRGAVHPTYLVAIVAAANAGGSGSVLGDTTTTMMWVAGVNPLHVLDAYVGAVAAFLFFAPHAAHIQDKHAPLLKHARRGIKPDWAHLVIVGLTLGLALCANLIAHLSFPGMLEKVPLLGLVIWGVLLGLAPWRQPDWKVLPQTLLGTFFLLSLVLAASLMPVQTLPSASWLSTFALGWISPIFDNIPLTALALEKGGFDFSLLAFAVGFAGSITWFGSTAGVAVCNLYPEAKSVVAWVRAGWAVPVAYLIGFFTMLAVFGWAPDEIGHVAAH